MDLDSPSPQGLGDHDERFRVPTPPPPPLPPPLSLPPLPPPTNEIIYTHSPTSLIFTNTLSNEPNKVFDDQNYNDRCQKLVEQLKEQYRQMDTPSSSSFAITKSESFIPTEDAIFKVCLGQSDSSSSENSLTNDNYPLTNNDNVEQEQDILLPLVQASSITIHSNRSRDEFVKLLTKEAYVSKSSSPAKVSYDYPNHRRRSYDDNDTEKKSSEPSNRLHSPRRYPNSSNNKPR
jgi:hypothetical protein